MPVNIDEFYQQFGPEVSREVRGEITRFGSLLPLLRRLGLHTPSELDEQHTHLRNFIFQYGVAFFLNTVRQGLSPAEIERRKVHRLVYEIAREPKEKRPRRRASDLGLPSKPSPGHPLRRASDKRLNPQPGTSGKQQMPPTTAPEAEDKAGWIRTPTYYGPNRRFRGDRRKGVADRRAQLVTVFKNRRFGGRDRRKMIRREEDRKKAEKEK